MSFVRSMTAAGAGLIGVGLLLPPGLTAAWLGRGSVVLAAADLVLGVWLLKAGLVALGGWLLVSPRFTQRPAEAVSSTGGKAAGPLDAGAGGRHTAVTIGVLVAMILVAAVLRLHRLGEGMWLDEILTYLDYVEAPFGESIAKYESQNQHFLYSILLGVGDTGIGLPQVGRRGSTVVPVFVVGVPVLVGVGIVLPRLGVGDCRSACR